MAYLGQEAETESGVDPVLERQAAAARSAAELRDTTFEEKQGTAIKMVAGVAIGMFILYRFLMK